MKKIILILSVLLICLIVNSQATDQTFEKQIYTKGGIKYMDGTIQMTAGVSGTITWASITGKPIFATVATTGSYTNLLNIPLTFPPATHNHDLSYKPLSYIPSWTEIINKPVEEELSIAIPSLQGIAIPKLTTVQITTITSPIEGLMVYDITLKVMKFWNGTTWKTIITNQ